MLPQVWASTAMVTWQATKRKEGATSHWWRYFGPPLAASKPASSWCQSDVNSRKIGSPQACRLQGGYRRNSLLDFIVRNCYLGPVPASLASSVLTAPLAGGLQLGLGILALAHRHPPVGH
jgi:hypothetical protein